MAEELITTANPYDDLDFFRKERFNHYPEIAIKDLLDVDDPEPIYEGQFKDSDGEAFFVFTLGGWLIKPESLPKRLTWKDDQGNEHGYRVGGDVMIITKTGSPSAAKALAQDALYDSLKLVVETAEHMERMEKARGSGIQIFSEIRGRKH